MTIRFPLRLVVLSVHLCLIGVLSVQVKNECKFADYESDEAVKEGMAKIAPLVGRTFQSQQVTPLGSYTYTVGICAKLDGIKDTNAVVVQQKMSNDQRDGQAVVIGLKNNTQIMSGSDWAVLDYRGGESYPHSCSQESRRTVIMLECDETIDDNSAEMVFVAEQKANERNCYYLFELKHSAMCEAVYSSSGISIGSILVIVFFCVTGAYLLVGFLYSRFVLGSKGKEQIPNYEFWKDFGNLQADGCDFVCRSKGRERVGFGGIGDDQLDPAEDIRDDNLLPM